MLSQQLTPGRWSLLTSRQSRATSHAFCPVARRRTCPAVSGAGKEVSRSMLSQQLTPGRWSLLTSRQSRATGHAFSPVARRRTCRAIAPAARRRTRPAVSGAGKEVSRSMQSQQLIPGRWLLLTSHQSRVTGHQSPVTSHESRVTPFPPCHRAYHLGRSSHSRLIPLLAATTQILIRNSSSIGFSVTHCKQRRK